MKKLIASALTALLLAGAAFAADLTPFTGPQDPSQINASLNALEQQIRTGVNGIVGAFPQTTASTATTAEQTLATITVPGGTLNKAGQSLSLKCAGLNAANNHSDTINLYYGTSKYVSPAMTTTSASWEVEMIVTYSASTTSGRWFGRGSYGAGNGATGTVIAPVASSNLVDDMSTGLVAKCTTTQGTASAADVTLYDFLVTQFK